MGDPLQNLSDSELRSLTAALVSGRLGPPYLVPSVGRLVGPTSASAVSARLSGLAATGMRPDHLASVANAILAARADRPSPEELVELVWTGPEPGNTPNRDTGVVVRELFATAETSVLVAGFAVYQGREVFRGLAERMVVCAGLQVRLFLDVHRTPYNADTEPDVVARFARRFVTQDWPDFFPRPAVYFDPRSLAADAAERASLHAKCVIVDRKVALVTSANFTGAAQERNIEVGVVVRSPRFASRLASHFDHLESSGLVQRMELPELP